MGELRWTTALYSPPCNADRDLIHVYTVYFIGLVFYGPKGSFTFWITSITGYKQCRGQGSGVRPQHPDNTTHLPVTQQWPGGQRYDMNFIDPWGDIYILCMIHTLTAAGSSSWVQHNMQSVIWWLTVDRLLSRYCHFINLYIALHTLITSA